MLDGDGSDYEGDADLALDGTTNNRTVDDKWLLAKTWNIISKINLPITARQTSDLRLHSTMSEIGRDSRRY